MPDAAVQNLRELLRPLPRVELGIWPTPLHRLVRFGAWAGHDGLYIKRDDLAGIGFGGNKVRSLEFLVGHARSQGADTLITGGTLQSNLCRLTAAAAARAGMACHIVHNEAPPERPEGNLIASVAFGARLHFVGPVDEEERARRMDRLAEDLRRAGKRPYVIHQGGSVPHGSLGYLAAALELSEQIRAARIDLKHVVIVGAMGGTAAGLLLGAAYLRVPFHVHVISVEYPAAELRRRLEGLWTRTAKLVGEPPPLSPAEVATIHDDYLGAGYAQLTAEGLEAAHRLARLEGLIVDLVYGAKTLAGLVDLVRRGRIPRGEPVCFWHTGGTVTLFTGADLDARSSGWRDSAVGEDMTRPRSS